MPDEGECMREMFVTTRWEKGQLALAFCGEPT